MQCSSVSSLAEITRALGLVTIVNRTPLALVHLLVWWIAGPKVGASFHRSFQLLIMVFLPSTLFPTFSAAPSTTV